MQIASGRFALNSGCTVYGIVTATNGQVAVVESIAGHSNSAMTRHYTHVGEVAVGRAVATLPTVIGEVPAEPPKRQEGEILRTRQHAGWALGHHDHARFDLIGRNHRLYEH